MSYLVLQSFTLLAFVSIGFFAFGWWMHRAGFFTVEAQSLVGVQSTLPTEIEVKVDPVVEPLVESLAESQTEAPSQPTQIQVMESQQTVERMRQFTRQIDEAKIERIAVYKELTVNFEKMKLESHQYRVEDQKNIQKTNRKIHERIDSIEFKLESLPVIDQMADQKTDMRIDEISKNIQQDQVSREELVEDVSEQSSELSEMKKNQTQLAHQLTTGFEQQGKLIDEIKGAIKDLAERPLKPIPRMKDDLRAIKGVGAEMERILNTHGIKKFEQIASMHATDVEKLSEELHFAGRIKRDAWVDQAKRILRERKLAIESMGVAPMAD